MIDAKSAQHYAVRSATSNDQAAVLLLLNQAYREPVYGQNTVQRQWTSEAHLVTGARLDANQYQQLLVDNTIQMLLLYRIDDLSIVGCIALTFGNDDVEIGSFAVCPSLQNSGLGQYLLRYAEQFARIHRPDLKSFNLYVLHVRQELIDYYVRRGYTLLAEFLDYPVGDYVGVPKLPLKLQRMQKSV